MTTYYVDTAVGNDANAGTSEGSGNAWATIDKAMSTVVAGDKVYIKASGTYSETPNIDTAGTLAAPITYEGYTSTPGDGGKATISGSTNCVTTSLAVNQYMIWKNMIFTGASSHAYSCTNDDYCIFYNCEFHTNGGWGIAFDNALVLVNCIFYGNTTYHVDADNSIYAFGCKFYNLASGTTSLNSASNVYMSNCLFYNNSPSLYETFAGILVNNCTFDGEGGSGQAIVLNANCMFFNNIVYDYDSATAAVGLNASHQYPFAVVAYNLVNGNATANYSLTGYEIGYQDVTSAPSFNNEAGDDYTLAADSPAINAGLGVS